ncbi:MAG: recombination protein RecR, partial [Anaerolineae bacterium]|nr:recombination protein RecR [Anaerolineae bacterium]
MPVTPVPVTKLIDEFSRLPGIGPKTASRLTFYLLRNPADRALALAEALQELHENVVFCSVCFHIDERDPCSFCTSESRDRSTICVVQEPLDVLAIERTREYQGLYHVLQGAIAPAEGIGPEELK